MNKLTILPAALNHSSPSTWGSLKELKQSARTTDARKRPVGHVIVNKTL